MTGYYSIRDELSKRVAEPAPARVQVLTGPRQVGKTTMLLELAREWGESAIYLAGDAPEAALPGWWEAQWRRVSELARRSKALLLVDEVQYLPQWSRVLKSAIDEVYRLRLPLHIVVSGSAALAVGAGTRETMAGRFERLVIRQWTARDLADAFGLERDEALERYVRFGSFPGSMGLVGDLPRWRAYVRDSIIEPAIGRDLMVLQPVRKPALLRQVFAVATGHPGEIVTLQKIAGSLSESGATATVAHYLQLLEEAYLVSPLQKFSAREIRRRSSPPKLIVLNNALLAGTLPDDPPTQSSDPQLWGRWVENACIAFVVANGQTVRYWREEPLEVDAVVDGAWGKWAIEVKSGPHTSRDLAGLLEFCRRWPEFRPLVVSDDEYKDVAERTGLGRLTWREFLWDGVAPLRG